MPPSTWTAKSPRRAPACAINDTGSANGLSARTGKEIRPRAVPRLLEPAVGGVNLHTPLHATPVEHLKNNVEYHIIPGCTWTQCAISTGAATRSDGVAHLVCHLARPALKPFQEMASAPTAAIRIWGSGSLPADTEQRKLSGYEARGHIRVRRRKRFPPTRQGNSAAPAGGASPSRAELSGAVADRFSCLSLLHWS